MKKNSKKGEGKKQGAGRREREWNGKVEGLLQTLAMSKERWKAEARKVEEGVAYFVGIDLGDRKSRCCFVGSGGEVVAEGEMSTTAEEMGEYFRRVERSRIALEVGTHSGWVSGLLEELGHEVYVANPRKMEGLSKRRRKNDRIDARILARYARADVELLHPIRHRGQEARQDLVVLRAREGLVQARSKLVNSVRGLVKSVGGRLRGCSTASFHRLDRGQIPEGIREAVEPMLEVIGELTRQIGGYDRRIAQLGREKYPETALLRQVNGVGELTSVGYVLTMEDPGHYAKSRDVGAYLGLVPREYESGDSSPQLRITKTGDRMMRRLLVGSGQYILGPFGKDCDLRRQGLKLAARGGKNAKKRAVVAVARKLAVLLHSLWRSGEVYEPLRQAARAGEAVLVTGRS